MERFSLEQRVKLASLRGVLKRKKGKKKKNIIEGVAQSGYGVSCVCGCCAKEERNVEGDYREVGKEREREKRSRAGSKGFRPSLEVDGVAADRLHPFGFLMPTEGGVSTSPA